MNERPQAPFDDQEQDIRDAARRARWRDALREGAIAGSAAGVASAAALALAGRRQDGAAAAPANATSQWLWGDRALREDRPSLRHTATGYLIHHGAAVFWGVLHARAWNGRAQRLRPGPALAGAAAASAVACLVDFKLTPHRLTPGFEHRLSRGALAVVYGCFALGMAAGSIWAARREQARTGGAPVSRRS
jgi:hypothetical protein